MEKKEAWRKAPILLVFLSFLATAPVVDAQSILRGGISLEQGYDSNINREPEDEISEWTTTVSPSLGYIRQARRSSLSLRYVPSIVHSYETDDTRVDHYASGEYHLQLTRNLQLDFTDTFVRTENPYSTRFEGRIAARDQETVGEQGEIELSDRRGRRKYWTNSFLAQAGYTYGQERLLEIGYRNQVLENRDDFYSDFVRHSPFANLSHRFNHQWATRLEYIFTKGDFDEPDFVTEAEDLTRHQANGYLYYQVTRFTRLIGHLGYSQTDYDEGSGDYDIYTAATGVEHRYSPNLDMGLEVGISWVERENFSDEDAFFLRAGFEKRWQRTTWFLEGESGLEAREFSGVDDLGLSRYWSVDTGFTRTLMRNVEARTTFFYRDDDFLDREIRDEEQYFEAAAGLAWSFAQWYEIYCRYIFVDQSSDIEADDYKDHRFFVGISAEKDLYQW